MRKRIVTYDVKEGNDYSKFYDLVDNTNAKMITESTYEFNTEWNQETFENNVHFISVSDKNLLFTKKINI